MKLKASTLSPLFVLVMYVILLVSSLLEGKLTGGDSNIYLSVILLQIMIFIIPSIIFCRLKGTGYSMKLNIKLFSPAKIGSIVTAAILLVCGSVLIRFAQIYLGGMTEFGFSAFDPYLKYATDGNFLYTAMAFAVMPAITEEFVFRAILLTEYNESGLGAVSASVITSLLYSMMFFSLEKLPVYFLAGIVFCTVTYVTGSSFSALFTHMIFNFYGIFGEKYVLKAIINPSNKIISIFTFSLLFLILAFITFGEFEHILNKTAFNGTPTPSYRLKRTDDGKTPDIAATEAAESRDDGDVIGSRARMNIEAFFSPTFLLCLLFFAAAVFGLHI